MTTTITGGESTHRSSQNLAGSSGYCCRGLHPPRSRGSSIGRFSLKERDQVLNGIRTVNKAIAKLSLMKRLDPEFRDRHVDEEEENVDALPSRLRRSSGSWLSRSMEVMGGTRGRSPSLSSFFATARDEDHGKYQSSGKWSSSIPSMARRCIQTLSGIKNTKSVRGEEIEEREEHNGAAREGTSRIAVHSGAQAVNFQEPICGEMLSQFAVDAVSGGDNCDCEQG